MPHSPASLIARVALRRTLQRRESAIFSYNIPPHLQKTLQPGQLVWVPLKSQHIQGIVLDISPTTAPPTNLRPIIDLADPEAIITAPGLRLAHEIAATYLVPLYEILALLLPPGVAQKAEKTWSVTPDGLGADLGTIPEPERSVLYYLRNHGATTEHDLLHTLHTSNKKLRGICAGLQERGLVVGTTTRRAPQVRPRQERIALPILAPEHLAATLETLHRSKKQQAVVSWLLEQSQEPHKKATQPQPWPVRTLYAATGANLNTLRALENKGILSLTTREIWRNPLSGEPILPDDPPPLTAGQRRVWEPISLALDHLSEMPPIEGQELPSPVFLLHGVTGSGKTEIYLRSVARALRLGRQALVLVPEIALTAQLVRRFAARFPSKVAVLHSSLSPGERYDEWRRVRRGDAPLVIGSRSAVFAPLTNPGVIIVDEEHEPGYKSDDSPRYHARDVALRLGALTGSIVILGSATPCIESYHAAQTGRFTLLSLPERVGGHPTGPDMPRTRSLPMPHVRLVDMRRELHLDNRSIFSHPLQQALATALERREQAILFLNRRGAAAFVMCRDCGHVIRCPSCDMPLIMHYDEESTGRSGAAPAATLICHSCRYHTLVPAFCPHCLSTRIKSFGIGTQRVEQEVQHLFPTARTMRWDRDSITGKGAHSRLLDQFLQREADILVGTQMIAKGLDLPHVSVVGVVAADTALYLPDFRSGERTFQLLTQVAGRAGRRSEGSQVIIQTYTPEHYALRAAQEHDYHAFYTEEIAFRQQTAYPPFSHLVRFVYSSTNQHDCQQSAEELTQKIHTLIRRLHRHDWGIIGPSPAAIARRRGRWRWHLLVRVAIPDAHSPILASFMDELGPLHGWSLDVDPVHVL